MKKLFIISILSFVALLLNGASDMGYQKDSNDLSAEIVLTNGNVLHGRIDMPKLKDDKINYINVTTDKKESIESSQVKYVQVWREKFPDQKYVFIYTIIKEYNARVTKEKLSKKPVWLFVNDVREHIRLFRSGDEYKISKKDGELQIIARPYGGQPTAPLYYLQRNDEQVPTEVGTFSMAENFMNLYGKMYFKDSPEMLETIKSRALRDKRINAVLDYYEMIVTSLK